MTADTLSGPVAGTPVDRADRRGRTDRLGWLGIGLITAVVAATWVPLLGAPFGDNHSGGITGRYALHLRNLQEKGLVDSHLGADWEPYTREPYAHHPPLRNMLDALFGSLPGDGEYQLRIAPFLLALLTIPAAAALLRGFGVRWLPTLLAVGLMVVTGYFWIYGHLRYDLGLILALSALVVLLRNRPRPPGWLVVATCVAALMATLQSWPGIATATALVLWLAMARRLDRVTIAVGLSSVIGIAISLAYMIAVHGIEPLLRQTDERTSSADYTAAEFLVRQSNYVFDLLPAWYLILFPIGLLAGLIDRRTRTYLAASTVFAAGWVLVLHNGAYNHEYWAFLVLVPGLVGMGALLDRVAGGLPARRRAVSATVAALALTIGAAVLYDGVSQQYHYQPTDAGRVAVAHQPPSGQQYAWHLRLTHYPRWLAYYWDLPPRPLRADRLADEAQPDDVVLVNLARLPDWLPDPIGVAPVDQEGHYAIYRAADLRSVARG